MNDHSDHLKTLVSDVNQGYKIISAEESSDGSSDAHARLFEARVVEYLAHPGVAPVRRLGSGSSTFYAMRTKNSSISTTLTAVSKKHHSRRQEPSINERLAPFLAICGTIAYAHDAGVIHGNLHPDALQIGPYGETLVTDWSSARAYQPTSQAQLGAPGAWHPPESLNYCAPEARDASTPPTSPTADIYSLGCILYNILTYVDPPLIIDIDRLPALFHGVPSALTAICQTALSQDPDKRFANAGALRAELKAFMENKAVGVYDYSPFELLSLTIRRNRGLVAFLGGVILAMIIGMVFSLKFAADAEHSAQQAELAEKRAFNALGKITDAAQQNLELSRLAAQALEKYSDELITDMTQIAGEIADNPAPDDAFLSGMVKQLHAQHDEIFSFSVIDAPGTIRVIAPRNSMTEKLLGKDVSKQQPVTDAFSSEQAVHLSEVIPGAEKKPMVLFLVPIKHSDQSKNQLLCAALHVHKIGTLFKSISFTKNTYIWCIETDGYVLYNSKYPERVGINLFDNLKSKALIGIFDSNNLAQRIRANSYGVGAYYRTRAEDDTIHSRVAAWATFEAGGSTLKLIAVEPFGGMATTSKHKQAISSNPVTPTGSTQAEALDADP